MKFFDNVGANIGLAQRLERRGDPLADPMFPRHLDDGASSEDSRQRTTDRMLALREANYKKRSTAMTDRRGFTKTSLMLTMALAILSANACSAGVVQAEISPDGEWAVELSDWNRPTVVELRSRPFHTDAWRKVGSPLKPDYDVSSFLISADSERVVYREGRTAIGDWALFSARVSGGAGTRISQPPLPGSSVTHVFRPISDLRVRYQYTPDGSAPKWYVVGVAGGRIWEEIFEDGFESGGVTRWN